MKIATYNVNSLRAREERVLAWLAKESPDVVCLQELKLEDDKVPTLALAGSLVKKNRVPESAGTLPTHSPLFIGWLSAVILLVGALNFLPALALGPVVEQLMMR